MAFAVVFLVRLEIQVTPRTNFLKPVHIPAVFELAISPVQPFHPVIDLWIVSSNRAQVAYEILYVHHIKASYGCVESQVDFVQLFPQYERTTMCYDDLFGSIESGDTTGTALWYSSPVLANPAS